MTKQKYTNDDEGQVSHIVEGLIVRELRNPVTVTVCGIHCMTNEDPIVESPSMGICSRCRELEENGIYVETTYGRIKMLKEDIEDSEKYNAQMSAMRWLCGT